MLGHHVLAHPFKNEFLKKCVAKSEEYWRKKDYGA
jgi:hypothetical protein